MRHRQERALQAAQRASLRAFAALPAMDLDLSLLDLAELTRGEASPEILEPARPAPPVKDDLAAFLSRVDAALAAYEREDQVKRLEVPTDDGLGSTR